MRNHLLRAAIVAGFVGLAGSAYAAPILVAGTYTITQSNSIGNTPTITYDLGSGGSHSFQESLNVGVESPAGGQLGINFFVANPAGSSGCTHCNNTASDTLTATFTLTEPSSTTPVTVSATAAYLANYSNQTDSISWSGATHNAQCAKPANDSSNGYCAVLVANFNDGAILDIILNNAEDWAITPTVAFDLVQGPTTNHQSVPEPATLALLGGSLVGLGVAKRRRKAA